MILHPARRPLTTGAETTHRRLPHYATYSFSSPDPPTMNDMEGHAVTAFQADATGCHVVHVIRWAPAPKEDILLDSWSAGPGIESEELQIPGAYLEYLWMTN